jgi:hypothetical protein
MKYSRKTFLSDEHQQAEHRPLSPATKAYRRQDPRDSTLTYYPRCQTTQPGIPIKGKDVYVDSERAIQ